MKNKVLIFSLLLLSGCGFFRNLGASINPPEAAPEPPKIDVVARAIANTVQLQDPEGITFCAGVATEGIIVTAAHCAIAFESFTIMYQGESYQAVVISVDPDRDIATVDAVGARLKDSVPLAEKNITWGSKVVWLGFPVGQPLTMGTGIVANPSVEVKGAEFFAVDGQFIPGHSGGPVLNYRGQLIGIISSFLGASILGVPQVLPVGYAVPLSVLQTTLTRK